MYFSCSFFYSDAINKKNKKRYQKKKKNSGFFVLFIYDLAKIPNTSELKIAFCYVDKLKPDQNIFLFFRLKQFFSNSRSVFVEF